MRLEKHKFILLRWNKRLAFFAVASPRLLVSAHTCLTGHPTLNSSLALSTTTTTSSSTPTDEAASASGAPVRTSLPLDIPVYSIWGANTNVGKTLVSVGLAHAASTSQVLLSYIKPVQTGFPTDSDARLVATASRGVMLNGAHAAIAAATNEFTAAAAVGARGPHVVSGVGSDSSGPVTPAHAGQCRNPRCTTLFAWRHAVSPHLAVRLEGRPVTDEQLVTTTAEHVRQAADQLRRAAAAAAPTSNSIKSPAVTAAPVASMSPGPSSPPPPTSPVAAAGRPEGPAGVAVGDSVGVILVETAGGVTSPAPSGRLACDVLRPLRLPAVLVGDSRLGGISATLSAYDSLTVRGWDVEAVVLVGQHSAPQVPSPGHGAAASPENTAGSNSGSRGAVDDGASEASSSVQGVPLDNLTFLRQYFNDPAVAVHRPGAPPPEVVGVPGCPPPPSGHDVRQDGLDPELQSWLVASRPAFTQLLDALRRRAASRTARLLSASAAAEASFWWPFTQHATLTHGSATVVDARCGETWTTLSGGGAAGAAAKLVPLYDASGSWWTQAATTELQPAIARAVSYAAGRYLHVLFPEMAHEPGLAAAEGLLAGPGKGWASRVFFSDDGSTAIELALKMAFRKFLADRGELPAPAAESMYGNGSGSSASRRGVNKSGGGGELLVLGLQGAYHGDTLGAQDCVAPSVFNGPLQAPWYRGRGLFLEPPYIGMAQGRWRILNPPAWLTATLAPTDLPTWDSLDDATTANRQPTTSTAMSSAASTDALTAAYVSYIERAIDSFEAAVAERGSEPSCNVSVTGGSGGGRLAACIMEPLVQGAGGMLVVEPGFQRAMSQVCRSRRLPLILDEVFSGLYRTGNLTAGAALGVTPDIACYAKLLTGGAAPLAATLASDDVFRAFSGPSKIFALLHGHSYTAYPIGCAAAAASLALLTHPDTNPNLCTPGRCSKSPACTSPCGRLLPLWNDSAVRALSYHALVHRVVAVGTVLALELSEAPSSRGYSSISAVAFVRQLRDKYGIYARPLGNVVYVMVPPTGPRSTCDWLLGALKGVLKGAAADSGGRHPGVAGGAGGRMGAVEESVVV